MDKCVSTCAKPTPRLYMSSMRLYKNPTLNTEMHNSDNIAESYPIITEELTNPRNNVYPTKVKTQTENSATVLSPSEKDSAFSPGTSETWLPVMNVTSSIAILPVKERRLSTERSQSMDSADSKTPSENSKTFNSQESLQSLKHKLKKTRNSSEHSSVSNSRESLSERRFSGESTNTTAPRQTSTSLRRQSLTRSHPSLKTITQKKFLGVLPKKPEKSINTETSNLKYVEPKVDTNRKQISKAKTQLVASVTQRLYAKANKKDSGIGTDTSLNSSRTDVPKELAIRNNARFRLRELTQRALKAHKNRNVETQTDLHPVLRVKEVSTGCNDLKRDLAEVKDACLCNQQETLDAAVECTLVHSFFEKTLKTHLIVTRSCGVQTTDDKPPISFRRYLTESNNANPIIVESLNINISHDYINGVNSNMSDDSLDNGVLNINFPTPDLICNHNSSEQHAQSSENEFMNKVGFANTNIIKDHSKQTILRLQSEEVGVANETYTANKPNVNKTIFIICTHAPQIVMPDIFKEKCSSLPNFKKPALISPKVIEYGEIKYYEPLIIRQPVMERTLFRISSDRSYSTYDESLVDEDQHFEEIDSVEFYTGNRNKIRFPKKFEPDFHHKNEKLFQAMTDFVSTATTLMENLTKTADKIDRTVYKNCLEDCELQVTVNDVIALDGSKKQTRKSYNRGVNTDCHAGNMAPVNKYETLLEESCRRMEQKINKRKSRSGEISDMSQDSDDEAASHISLKGNSFSKTEYNVWDWSNLEVEDSSLESNPVTFSDYGSLPRKTHKRRRTPTCSPSAFLKQLTDMRKQILETSREELLKNHENKSC